MRSHILFGLDAELVVAYEDICADLDGQSSASLWMVPGTHPDDPSFRA
jgi:hypothetical protein